CLLLLAEINGQWLHISFLMQVHYGVQMALLVGGIGLLAFGLSRRDWRWPVLPRRDMLFLGGIVLLALVLRLVALDSTIHRFVDEINFIDAITRLWDTPNVSILRPFSDVTAFTWVYTILQNITGSLFGTNLVGLRMVSVIFGTLTVPALYFLARTLFHDRWLALLAALVLATFPPQLHFSRIGINNIADPLFGTLALAFLIRGLRSQRRSDFIVAGAALGLTQYFYEGGRLLFPCLTLAIAGIYWLVLKDKWRNFKALLWLAIAAGLIAAPVYYTIVGNREILMPRLYSEAIEPDWYFNLLTYTGDGSSEWLTQRYADPLLLYVARPDMGWFYGGNQALILVAVVPFFFLGAGCLIWKPRSPAAILLLLWLLLTALGNSFLRESASSPRYVLTFPALALLIALGLRYLLSDLSAKRWQMVIGVLVVYLVCGGQVIYYFYDHLPAVNQQLRQPEEWEDALFRLKDLPAGAQAHFIMQTPVREFNLNAFVRYWHLDIQVDAKAVETVTDTYLQSLVNLNVKQFFFVNESQSAVLARLRQHFTLSEPLWSLYDVPQANQLARYDAGIIWPYVFK
ncbi:MAG: glycosyltransferase family 39 protein, partial [Anaerolineae bacterium]|nr:glycosyltransferase family 39 protein [Anaerolineae bacterium]